ncbi:hypothetical protein BCR44DRAFT_1428475 [Catenaria anguillulae PL171]|uniref:L domain-like protein n=1 Tax=Catenaria anguillulae PL171 TaxID=765915 RepID=A0A1Y2HVA6_9FUNG|nr:hypothetical protein BCR44DRAFT_1428475 [Catenaria anguillulae PL171]
MSSSRSIDLAGGPLDCAIVRALDFADVQCEDGRIVSITIDKQEARGPITESIGDLTMLRIFTASGQKLSGTLPTSLKSLTQLEQLDLSGNSLHGPIPDGLSSMSTLKLLYAAFPQIADRSCDGTTDSSSCTSQQRPAQQQSIPSAPIPSFPASPPNPATSSRNRRPLQTRQHPLVCSASPHRTLAGATTTCVPGTRSFNPATIHDAIRRQFHFENLGHPLGIEPQHQHGVRVTIAWPCGTTGESSTSASDAMSCGTVRATR